MGTDTGYVKVAADPEQVDGTILDGRDYSSGQLPQENIRIIKEADATLRLNLEHSSMRSTTGLIRR